MKKIKLALLTVFALAGSSTFAQTSKAITAKIVEAKQYTFVARSANPQNAAEISQIMGKIGGGSAAGTINIAESYYQVKVTTDSVIAYLPYYGRSFSAPINNNEGGIKFTSTKFDYKTTKGKKRGWNVAINVKEPSENYRLMLNISETGYASLSVNSSNKQNITYSGVLKENGK